MMLKSLFAAAGFAAAATAILLPPELSESDLKFADIVATNDLLSDTKTVKAACPGCPLRFIDGDRVVEKNVKVGTHLDLMFELAKDAAGQRLLVNGFELFPNADPVRSALTAPVRANAEWKQAGGRKFTPANVYNAQLGFGLQTHPVAKEADLEMIQLDLQIFEVADEFVSGIPDIKIVLLIQNGDVMIQSINLDETQTAVAVEGEAKPECKTLMCSWIEFAKAKLAKLKAWKGCHGKKVGAHHHHHKNKGHGHHGKGGSKKLDSHHKMHHGHFRQRTWGQLFKSIAAHILLPVLIGIAAGISVSLIGMLVGTVIISTWRFFFRSGRRHHHHHRRHHSSHSRKASVQEAAVTEEKAGLLADQDAPPAYEEAEEQKPDAEA